MKKNISINISGIIFHIEEDGYGKLKEYLESINSYFSSYEDSSEIIADIESRVAEIFLSKLDDGKQIITAEDVDSLIATMGTIADFEAIEDDEDKTSQTQPETEPEEEKTEEQQEEKEPKKLIRDEKRKILGGVGAGMAYYFGIDPLWVRIILILLLFLGPVGGAVLVAYIVLWIVMPGSTELGDDAAVKKMYRDSDNSVMGGVASGIAAYFGTDVTVIRLVFVLSFFLGGTGLILYIILWMITPEAKSITEKMEMQGEPVTLSNIEQNVKDSLNVKDGEEESALVKILLFPFRVLATIFKALGELLGPASKIIVEGLRILAGLFVTGVGVLSMICLIVSIGVVFGFVSNWGGLVQFHDIPVEMLRNSLPTIGFISIFIASIVPFFGLTLLGISILLKRFVLNAAIGWSLFGFWILSMIGLGLSTRSIYVNFRNEGEYNETRTFEFKDEIPVFKLEYRNDMNFDMTQLKIRGHSDSTYQLDLRFQSHGKTRKEAKDNAEMLTYDVIQSGNELVFASDFNFDEGAQFRAQELDMTLYVPYGSVFMMDEDLKEIIRSTINRNGYRVWQMEGNQWMFTEDNGLECITCEESYSRRKRDIENITLDPDQVKGESVTYELGDFTQIETNGNFDVYITQGAQYSVELKSSNRNLKKSYVRKYDDVLEIDMEESDWDNIRDLKKRNKVKVFITLPKLKKVDGRGITDFTIEEFSFDDLEVKLSGASSADINIVTANDIEIDLDGLVSATIQGDAKYLDADLSGAARLKAYTLNVQSAKIDTKDASSARVNVRESLEVTASGMSSVKYKGDPDVSSDEDGFGKVRRTD